MSDINTKILTRIRKHGRGKRVFTARDFHDLGARAAVAQALSRLTRRGILRRVGTGLYDLPRMSKVLGSPAPPDMDAVLAALVRRDGMRVLPGGMASANNLGLTNAVAAKTIYFTDGSSRDVKIGNRVLRFRRACPKVMSWADRPAAPVVQALRWLGPQAAAEAKVIATLRRNLPDSVKDDMADNIAQLPHWAADIARDIVAR